MVKGLQMLVQRRQPIAVVWLFPGLLGGIGMNALADKTTHDPELPVKKMVVTVGEGQLWPVATVRRRAWLCGSDRPR